MINSEKRRYLLAIILIFCAIFYSYQDSLSNGFVLDDYDFIINKVAAHTLSPVIRALWETDHSTEGSVINYRPGLIIGAGVLYYFFHEQAYYYHLFNLITFGIICGLFFFLVKLLTGDYGIALLSALLFSIHPINSTPVNNITMFSVLYNVLFCQLAMIAFVLFIQNEKKSYLYSLSIFFFILGFFFHEVAVILLIPVVLYLLLLTDCSFKKIVKLCAPYGIIALIYLVFKFFSFSLWRLISWYWDKLIIPEGIVWMWPAITKQPSLMGRDVVYLVFIIFLTFSVVKIWKKNIKSWAFLSFLIGLAPLSVLCFVFYSLLGFVIEPHWFLFTSIGFFVLMAIFLKMVYSKVSKILGIIICFFIFVYWAQGTRSYSPVWKDKKTYCQYWVKITPQNLFALRALGNAYISTGDPQTGLIYLEHVSKQSPHAFVYAEMGKAYAQLGKFNEAKVNIYRSLEAGPPLALAYNTLGTIFFQENNYPSAEENFVKAVEINPFLIDAWLNLGDLSILMNKNEQAVDSFSQILKIEPRSIEKKQILAKLAISYFRLDQIEQSSRILEKFLKEYSGPESFIFLANAFNTTRHPEMALEILNSCIAVYPAYSEAYIFSGVIQGNSGKFAEAIAVWEKGQKIFPADKRFLEYIVKAKNL